MVEISLLCLDKRFTKGDWLLVLDEQGGALTDPEGTTKATFSCNDAESRFVFPSFWESVKDLGVRTDSGDLIWFYPDRECIAEIKTYLHGALAAQGPAAVRSTRTRGRLLVLAGLGITLFAVFVMVASMANLFGNAAGGRYYLPIGAAIFGLIVLSRGISAVAKATQADRETEVPKDIRAPEQELDDFHRHFGSEPPEEISPPDDAFRPNDPG